MQQGQPVVPHQTFGEEAAGPSVGQTVFRRKWLLLFGVVTGVGLGYLYFTTRLPVFRSDAQVMIVQRQPQLPVEGVRRDYETNLLDTQAYVVTSEAVVRLAIDKFGLDKAPTLGGRDAAFSTVAAGLKAVPTGEANILTVSYLGRSPAECHAVLDAVVKAYKNFLGETEQTVSEETVKLIAQAKDDLLKDLQKLESEYQVFRGQSPLLWKGDEGVNVHTQRLVDVEAQRTGLVLERSRLQARVDSIRNTLATGGSREALTLMVNQLREGGGTSANETANAAERLFPLLLEREILASKGLGTDHPDVVSIEKQIEMTRSHTARLTGGNLSAARPKDILDIYLDSLGYEIEANIAEEAKLARLFETEQIAAREVDAFHSRDSQLRQDIARKQALFDGVVKRLDETSLFDATGLRTEVLKAPKFGYQTSVGLPTNLLIGGFGGLAISLVLAYMVELGDKSFRTPEDIRDQLGVPVLGHVPVITEKAKVADGAVAPVLCTIHKPKSSPAESYRLVRTSIFFSTRGNDVKVLQVTSPDQGDGKSTLAANLAVTIAASGRRTLLVDADMRRPTVHRLFRVSDEVGLSTVIGGQRIDPSDAIQETSIPNLSILPCGPRPHNPAELLSSAEFENFLAWVKDRYDFVLIDTPPLLAVSDPGAVAARVDAVLVTLRLSKRVRAKGVEARQILEHVGANVLGVVINGVDARGDYGYQAYRYGNGYGYRYGYRYRYGNSYGNSSYYKEEPATPRANGSLNRA